MIEDRTMIASSPPATMPCATAGSSPKIGAAVDVAERALVLSLYAWLVWRVVAVYLAKGSPADLILLPSEGLVVLLLLLRRGTRDISRRAGDWILALGATTTPMLARPGLAEGLVSPAVASVVMLIGIFIQVHAKLALGRSIGCVPANRGLKFCGPYRYVRHPMYLGYLISHCGFVLMNPSLWNVTVYLVCYSLQVPRLLAEERLLSQDPDYRRYAGRVHYRLLPGVY